jgi:hypothetical protein
MGAIKRCAWAEKFSEMLAASIVILLKIHEWGGAGPIEHVFDWPLAPAQVADTMYDLSA